MLVWSDWPARRTPKRATLVAALILLTALVIAIIDPILAVLGTLLLIGATADTLSPTTYKINEKGIELHNPPFRWVRRPWVRFIDWHSTKEGFLVEDRSPIQFLKRRRSLLLRFPENPERLKDLLQTHISGGKPS